MRVNNNIIFYYTEVETYTIIFSNEKNNIISHLDYNDHYFGLMRDLGNNIEVYAFSTNALSYGTVGDITLVEFNLTDSDGRILTRIIIKFTSNQINYYTIYITNL